MTGEGLVLADPLQEDLKQFLVERLGTRVERLALDSRLQHDLGVDGADGWELIDAFSRGFDVDLAGFQADLHFGPEAGCNPLAYMLLFLLQPQNLRFVPITVKDLVEAARSRRWQTPSRPPS
jgi:hypothetical protein